MATSYSNICGSGDRRAVGVLVIANGAGSSSSINMTPWIDGNLTDNTSYFSGANTGNIIEFWFPSKKIIDEVKFYQQNTATHGTWKWQGSQDRSTWTDIGSTFTLGGATLQTITSLSGNIIGYVYYRMFQVSGTTSGSPYIHEFEFKIDDGGGASYLDSLGSGNRTSLITITSSGVVWEGSANPLDIINGSYANSVWWNFSTNAGHWVKFDFGSDCLVQQARFRLNLVSPQGDWKIQGSTDDSTWTDLSITVTVGSSSTFWTYFTGFESNAIAYRYYRMLGVSGTRNTTPYLNEIEFMIGESGPPVVSSVESVRTFVARPR